MADTTKRVTPRPDLAGILPVVISGNRPLLGHRATHRLLAPLRGVTADPVWLIRDEFADLYERDGHEIVTYSRADAEEYAARNWIGPDPYAPGGFLGCFTEREWACRIAAERGCWAVLQLDDNIARPYYSVGYGVAADAVVERGGLAMYADVLAAVTLSTNSRMTGACLASVSPQNHRTTFARAGYPMSLFVERVDLPDRPPYCGPIEEDILHCFEYGDRPDDGTAAIVIPLCYQKEHVVSARSGMRKAYQNQRRSAGLQRVAPEAIKSVVKRTHSNGKAGHARIFHQMKSGSIRTPLVVRDQPLFDAARNYCADLQRELGPALLADAQRRAAARAKKGEARSALLAHLS